MPIHTFRFRNSAERMIRLVVEPWANEFEIGPGQDCMVSYEGKEGREDRSCLIWHGPDLASFWVEGSDVYKVEIDGELVDDHWM